MLDLQAILDAARRAADAASCPAEVLLFGSYARGDADPGSDLDLMVIEDQVDDKIVALYPDPNNGGNRGRCRAAREGRCVHDARA